MHACMYVCMYVCVCVYIYACMYVYMQLFGNDWLSTWAVSVQLDSFAPRVGQAVQVCAYIHKR